MARNPIVGGIGFELTVDDSKFIQQLRKSGERGKRELEGTTTAADRLEDELRQAGNTGQRSLRQIETGADRASDQLDRARRNVDLLRNTVSGLALGAVFVQGAKTIAAFSQSMSTLEAVSGAVGGEFEGLRNKALELGASTRFSATQAADAMGELARAGFTAVEVLAAIGPTLSAAQAGGADIASTAEIIGSTIRGFGIEATDAARVADVLAQAANASNAGITDLGEALKFAAPTARQLGLDLESTIAVIGKLSDGGLKGGLAGRGFQSLATQIVNNRTAISGLIGDFNLAEEGIGGVLGKLQQAGITVEQIIKIFRAENLDTFGILANASVDESLGNLEKILRAAEGSSARTAAIMDDNLNGAILATQSRLEALIIAMGDAGGADALIAALEGLGGLLKLAADNADVLQAAIIALSVRALLPMAVAMGGRVIASVVAMQAQLTILTAIAGRSTTALAASAAVAGRLALALGPLTIGIALAAAAYLALARDAEQATERLERATSAIQTASAALLATQDLVTGSDSPLKQVSDQASAAARTVAALTGVIDGLTGGLANLRKEGQLSTVFEIGDAIAVADASIAELEAARSRAIGRAGSARSDDRGPAQARAAARFDAREEGQALLRLRQQRAFLELRARKAAEGLSVGDVVDQFRGRGAAAPAPGAAAPEPGALPADTAVAKAIKPIVTEVEAAYRDMYESPLQALDRWKTEQLAAIAIVEASEAERAAQRDMLDAVYQGRYDELFIAEEKLKLETINAEASKQRAIDETLAARDLEIGLQLAQLRGDKDQVKALEAKIDRQARINDLLSSGLTLSEATLRAESEIATIQTGTPGEAEAAKRAFADGLSGDISSALNNAIRSGDYGAVFQEIINSSAARGLEQAIADLADSLANLFANIAFGENGAGGILSDVIGGGFTPPILDAGTAGAVAESAAETAATASITGLGVAATGAATAAAALSAGQAATAAAAATLTAALSAAVLAAQAAATALAAVSASTAGSTLTTALSFGGGRRRGGPVVPGKFYEVNEGGIAEMLRIGSKNFLLPGSAGQVTPLAGAQAPGPRERTVARHDIYVHGTGNQEIQRAVDAGVQRSVRASRAQAGPAAAEFQTRKV